MTPEELAALFTDPADAGRRAQAVRATFFGRRVAVRPTPPHAAPAVAATLRGGEVIEHPPRMSGDGPEGHVRTGSHGGPFGHVRTGSHGGPDGHVRPDSPAARVRDGGPTRHVRTDGGDPGWPDPAAIEPGDRVVLQVDHGRADAYFEWLARAAAIAHEWSLAPFCAQRGGLFRLHLIAAARIASPANVRVEARHDLIGIRLAQVALGFGADVLSGPIARARSLPLAGVTRPDEATPAGLSTLIEQAGLEPVLWDIPEQGAEP